MPFRSDWFGSRGVAGRFQFRFDGSNKLADAVDASSFVPSQEVI
jgi:hypothetical protein